MRVLVAAAIAVLSVATRLVNTHAVNPGEVSVCRDATYTLPSTRGNVCSGAGGPPIGFACPKKGDVATNECKSYLPSFDGVKCVAKEDALCEIVHGDTWGCVFPSVGCVQATTAPRTRCPLWEESPSELLQAQHEINVFREFQQKPVNTYINSQADGKPSCSSDQDDHPEWFTQDTPLEIIVCGTTVTIGKPTPAPSTLGPVTPAPTTLKPVTPAPTSPVPPKTNSSPALTTMAPSPKPTPAITTPVSSQSPPPTQALPTQAPPTQAPPTQAPTQVPQTQAPPTQALQSQAPPKQAPPTQAPLLQAPQSQALPTQAPSTKPSTTEAPPTQVPPRQASPTQAQPTQVPPIQKTQASLTETPPDRV